MQIELAWDENSSHRHFHADVLSISLAFGATIRWYEQWPSNKTCMHAPMSIRSKNKSISIQLAVVTSKYFPYTDMSTHTHACRYIYVYRSVYLFIVRSMHTALIFNTDIFESINDGYIEICTFDNGEPHPARHCLPFAFVPTFCGRVIVCIWVCAVRSDINLCIFVREHNGI